MESMRLGFNSTSLNQFGHMNVWHRFEKSEMVSAAKETLKRILEIPFNVAQTMLMTAAGHLSSGSGRSRLGMELDNGI